MPVTIATRTVRHFFAEDWALAEAVAATLDRLDDGKPRHDPQWVVDLSHHRPLPAPGTIEVSLPPPPPVAR